MPTRFQEIQDQMTVLEERISSLENAGYPDPVEVQSLHEQIDQLLAEVESKEDLLSTDIRDLNKKVDTLSALISGLIRRQHQLKQRCEKEVDHLSSRFQEHIREQEQSTCCEAVTLGVLLCNTMAIAGLCYAMYSPENATAITEWVLRIL